MAVRNKRKCRNCPEETVQVTPEVQTPTLHISSESEGKRLWKNVLFGAGAWVSMIEGYQSLGMPGEPAEAINGLVSRLQQVLKKIEVKNEVQSTPQREALNESDSASGRMVGQALRRPVQQGVRNTDSLGSQPGRIGSDGRSLRRDGQTAGTGGDPQGEDVKAGTEAGTDADAGTGSSIHERAAARNETEAEV